MAAADHLGQKPPPTTAAVLGVFAKELEDQGFDDARITVLLAVALEREIRDDGLTVFDV